LEERDEIQDFLESIMNNTFYQTSLFSKKNKFNEKLASIFDEIRKNEKLVSLIPSESISILTNENFNLEKLSSFPIFNDLVLRNLNIIYLFLIQPSYTAINKSLISNMGNILNLYSLLFIGFFTFFIASVLMFYFLDWRPLQNDLDSTVNIRFKIFLFTFIIYFSIYNKISFVLFFINSDNIFNHNKY